MKTRIHHRLMFVALLLSTTLGFAVPITFTADLAGPNEVPPTTSPGTGNAVITFDLATHTLEVNAIFSGLVSYTTASHIHCCTLVAGVGNAGVATQVPTFVGFPLGVTSGTYSHTFDTSLTNSWNPAFIIANGGSTATAENTFAAGLLSGTAYFNIHTQMFPGGEIRGSLVATSVPEPATIALFGLGLLGFAASHKRKKK
jgi:hypothetical protein